VSREDPGASQGPSEGPSPDLRILETRVYRGPNYWAYDRAVHLLVDLGSLEDWPSDRLPGFTDELLRLLPGLVDHTCGVGRRGGFVERLREGTWLGHVAEHVALQLQREAGGEQRRGKTRGAGERGRYNVIYGYSDERVGVAAGRLAVRLSTTWSSRRPASTSTPSWSASSCRPSGPRSGPPPRRSSTRPPPATSPGYGSTTSRWCSSARASTSSASAPP
jgi:hypothetical protein